MAGHIFHPLLFALLAITISLPSARGVGDDRPIGQVTVQGRLFCTVTRTPELGLDTPGAGGVNVGFVCEPALGGVKTVIGSAVTNATGHFETVVNNNDDSLVSGDGFDPKLCYLQVSLPVESCDLFPPTGFLRAALLPFEVVDGVFGSIAKFLSGVFVHSD